MNFQNIPRKDKVVKTGIGPKLDALLMCDYKQIEPRLLGFYLSSIGDDTLAAYIRGGTDPYTAIVTKFLGRDDFTEEERQNAKIVFLSQMYGGGAGPIAEAFECSWPEATRIARDFHDAWPGIRQLQAALGARLKQRGYFTTLWGRHLHPQEEHKYINALIQGCAADLMKAAAIKVHRYLTLPLNDDPSLPENWTNPLWAGPWESHLVNLVHDEMILDCVRDELPYIADIVPRLMNHKQINDIVPIGVDVEVSYTNWAEKEAYEDPVLR